MIDQWNAPIGDYAIIGDCRSAALVSRSGSIDWLCWPQFDSPSIFGALLDSEAGGRWYVQPEGSFQAKRRYVPNTNVLLTEFSTPTGTAILTDFMPVYAESEKHQRLLPEHEIIRYVQCTRGQVTLSCLCDLRPDYGAASVTWRSGTRFGVYANTKRGEIILRAQVPIDTTPEGARSRFTLKTSESSVFSLSLAEMAPAVFPPLGEVTNQALKRSITWWEEWADRTTYRGPHRDAVVRSALVLKLLAFAPSGAIIASPTTSLPEQVGGALNWDYRYCWIRDAALTARALFGLGHYDEANAFIAWLLHTTRLTWPALRILYDVFGRSPAREHELPHLSGYRGSRPVRVGNAATEQLQLDVYGEIIEASAQFILHGGSFDRESAQMLSQFGEYVCKHWQEPDEGIWETREGRFQHTFSKLLCWAALDRLIELNRQGHLARAPISLFETERDKIRHRIETRGWNSEIRAYTQTLDGSAVDASALLIPWYGFEPADSVRMQQTYARIKRELGRGPALLLRYLPAPGKNEGAFGICSFWCSEFLALGGGRLDEAQESFAKLLTYSNDVGIFAEEIDPDSGGALGNFPQGFTHIGLINAALSIQHRLEAGKRWPRRVPSRGDREPLGAVR